jgi:hypothetical protein
MSGRRRIRAKRAEIIAKLEQMAAWAALDPSASPTEQEMARVANTFGLGNMSMAGWAKVSVRMSYVNYRKTGDPLYAWKALMACRRHGADIPRWIDSYLAQTTARIIAPNGLHGDVGRCLTRALGFPTKRGTRGRVPDRIDDIEGTRLAVEFARAIMGGDKPDVALARAYDGIGETWENKDRRTLLACVRRRFNIMGATHTRAHWEAGIAAWFEDFAQLEAQLEEAVRQ